MCFEKKCYHSLIIFRNGVQNIKKKHVSWKTRKQVNQCNFEERKDCRTGPSGKAHGFVFQGTKIYEKPCSHSLDVRDDLAQKLRQSPSISPATSYQDLSELQNNVFLDDNSPIDNKEVVTRDGLLSPPQNSYHATRRRLTAPDVIPLDSQTLARLQDVSASGIRRGSAPNLTTLRLEGSFKQPLSTLPGPTLKMNTLFTSGKPTVKQIGRCTSSQRPQSASPALGKSLGHESPAASPPSRSLSTSPCPSPPLSPRTASPQRTHSPAWRQLSVDSALTVNQSSQMKDSSTPGQPIRRSSSAQIVRSRSPCAHLSSAVSQENTISQSGCYKLRARRLERSDSTKSQKSALLSRRTPEISKHDRLWPEIPSHLRRNSAPVQIDIADLSAVSPLRKVLLGTSSSQNSCPASPLLARSAPGNREELQLRVKEFLKSLPTRK